MKIITALKDLKKNRHVLAIGTFDGVHLGHRRVIMSAVERAKKLRLPAVVLTFDPHPQSFIHPKGRVALLTTMEERAFLIEKLGVDVLLALKFDKKMHSKSYSKFANDLLSKKLGAAHVFVGQDYTFGKNKEGNLAGLKRLGKELGFAVTGVEDIKERRRVVKSTFIRGLVSKGEFLHALKLLGHPYIITGKVVKGEGTGKLLGFPTANIAVDPHKLLMKDGVYAGRTFIDGKRFKVAINVGTNPTFGRHKRTVEAYIIGKTGDLLGKKLRLFVEKHIRGEKKFPYVKELVRAIGHDVLIAEKKLA